MFNQLDFSFIMVQHYFKVPGSALPKVNGQICAVLNSQQLMPTVIMSFFMALKINVLEKRKKPRVHCPEKVGKSSGIHAIRGQNRMASESLGHACQSRLTQSHPDYLAVHYFF